MYNEAMQSEWLLPVSVEWVTTHKSCVFCGQSFCYGKCTETTVGRMDEGKTDKQYPEKEDSTHETDPPTWSRVIDPTEPTSKDTTAPISVSSGTQSLFDNWTDSDTQYTDALFRDAQHVIRVTNQLVQSPLERISLRHRRFWSKRGWRQRVRDWREKAPSGMWYPCEMREGPDEDPRMPMCKVCNRKIYMHGQVCLSNICRVPE